MKGALVEIEGNWGHFKKPETNNNPLTHDFITKTALIGMIGAVLGFERREMAPLFPQLSEDLRYGVCVRSPVRKESCGFIMRRAIDPLHLYPGSHRYPKYLELLKAPRYTVAIALDSQRSGDLFDNFLSSVERDESLFTPVLGLHNCPANLALMAVGEFEKGEGEFTTSGFITGQHTLNTRKTTEFRLGVERIPTFQDDDFWNLPEKYVRVIYPSEGREIFATGDYFSFTDQSQWVLI